MAVIGRGVKCHRFGLVREAELLSVWPTLSNNEIESLQGAQSFCLKLTCMQSFPQRSNNCHCKRYGEFRVNGGGGGYEAYSRLSSTQGHVTDCKLDSVVYAGVVVVIFRVNFKTWLLPMDTETLPCKWRTNRWCKLSWENCERHRVLSKYGLCRDVASFLFDDSFPQRSRWKETVNNDPGQ